MTTRALTASDKSTTKDAGFVLELTVDVPWNAQSSESVHVLGQGSFGTVTRVRTSEGVLCACKSQYKEPACGYKWRNVGKQPPAGGTELLDDRLASTLRRTLELPPTEWEGLDIQALRMDCFIKVDDSYFQPVQTAFGVDTSFLREVAAYQLLEGCPGVIRCLGIALGDGPCSSPRLFLELADSSLEEELCNLHSDEQLNHWEAGLFDAVRAIHRRGVMHRDLKPANVLLMHEGGPSSLKTIRLGDFGSMGVFMHTSLEEREQDLTTYPYAAPEVLRGEAYGPSADVWSIGVIMLELRTRRRLFCGPYAERVLQEHEQLPSILRDATLTPRVRNWLEDDPHARESTQPSPLYMVTPNPFEGLPPKHREAMLYHVRKVIEHLRALDEEPFVKQMIYSLLDRYTARASDWTQSVTSLTYVATLLATKLVQKDAIPPPWIALEIVHPRELEQSIDFRELECAMVRCLPTLFDRATRPCKRRVGGADGRSTATAKSARRVREASATENGRGNQL